MKNLKGRCWIKILILIFLSGCVQSIKQSNYTVIDLSKSLPMNPVKASTLINNCRYIPLETTKESVIGIVQTLIPIQEGFLILSSSKMLSFFDNEGHFICHISRKGRGPGEYIDIHSLDVSDLGKNIYLFDGSSRQILIYTFDNKFVRSIRTDNHVTKILKTSWGYISYKDPLLNFGKETAVLATLDENGNEINVLQYRKVDIGQFSPWVVPAILKNINDKYYYYPPFQDTLYSVQVDKIVPEFVFPKGKYSIDIEEMVTLEKSRSAICNGIVLNDFMMDRHQFIQYCYRQNKPEIYLYNFASGKIIGVSEIINDLDNSYKFSPHQVYMQQWFEINDAHEILEESAKLPSALKNLKPEDNAVIRIATLK